MRHGNPTLVDLLRAHAETVLNQLEGAPLRQRVRDRIVARGAHASLRLGDVAADLGMSERHLRRQLQALGTSFRSELEGLLGPQAVERLADQSVDRVASSLGYADAAAFRRAFRRWYGASPRGVVTANSSLTP
jgi:AraC-like DNA-binding protein